MVENPCQLYAFNDELTNTEAEKFWHKSTAELIKQGANIFSVKSQMIICLSPIYKWNNPYAYLLSGYKT